MPAYSIKELQQHIIPILTDVDRVCREHNIRCYICDGTMLGAVRHGGFIPWDDDIDVCMPRPDYERFMAHAKEWPIWKLSAQRTTKITHSLLVRYRTIPQH